MSRPIAQSAPTETPDVALPPPAPTKTRSFQQRVDYASKALRRGRWGRRFDACFEGPDAAHVTAVLVLRAERSRDLKEAILRAFKTKDWGEVPWVQTMSRFSGMGAREIGQDALRAQAERDASG
jgi:hypothetical protein